MKDCLRTCAVGVFATVLLTPVWGFEVLGTKTEAGVDPSRSAPVIQIDFSADVVNEGFRELPISNVGVEWGEAAGIGPGIRVVMPIGCFVRNRGFHVEDFRSCGVRVEADFGLGTMFLTIIEFEASLKPRNDVVNSFSIVVIGFPPDDSAPAILGLLGGSPVHITIGAETVMTVPISVEAVGATPPDDT